MFHGGGYKECSGKDADVMDYLCKALANRGFVAFNFEYRAGRRLSQTESQLLVKTVQQQLAVGRAVQDVRGAIRSVCKMQDDNFFATNYSFQIDKTKIFSGGQSAGCGAVLSAAYLQTPDMVDAASPGVFSALGGSNGGLDANYYYAPPSYVLPNKVIKGVFDMWGEFPMPGEDDMHSERSDFFSDNLYIPPVIAFHGDDDLVAATWQRAENYPSNVNEMPSVTKTNRCINSLLTITHASPTANKPSDIRMVGSLELYNLVIESGGKAEVYIDCQMAHGLDKNDGASFDSDFGTDFHTNDEVNTYMVQRATIFFQSILKGGSIPGPSKFINQKNTRFNKLNASNNCVSGLVATPNQTCDSCNVETVPDCN